jgi:hypothetical protein
MEWKDEIVEEVRRVRDAYAAKFDYNISRICTDLRKRQLERERRERPVSLPQTVGDESTDVRNAA